VLGTKLEDAGLPGRAGKEKKIIEEGRGWMGEIKEGERECRRKLWKGQKKKGRSSIRKTELCRMKTNSEMKKRG
jgi:hypothetical protein